MRDHERAPPPKRGRHRYAPIERTDTSGAQPDSVRFTATTDMPHQPARLQPLQGPWGRRVQRTLYARVNSWLTVSRPWSQAPELSGAVSKQ